MYRHTGKLYNYNNKMHEAHEHYKSSSIWSFSLDSGDTSVLSFSVGCSSRCDCLATDSPLNVTEYRTPRVILMWGVRHDVKCVNHYRHVTIPCDPMISSGSRGCK